ncbi:MAG: hypothetical protein WBB45_03380 [Cyclobacteriaceae bacterium]
MTKEDIHIKSVYDNDGITKNINDLYYDRIKEAKAIHDNKIHQLNQGKPALTPPGFPNHTPHKNLPELIANENKIHDEKLEKIKTDHDQALKENFSRLHKEHSFPDKYHPEHKDFPFNDDYGFEPNEAQKQKGMDEKVAIKENALKKVDERIKTREAYQRQSREITKDSPIRHYRESKESILQHLDKKQQSREGAKQVRVEDKTKEPDK